MLKFSLHNIGKLERGGITYLHRSCLMSVHHIILCCQLLCYLGHYSQENK